MICCTLYIKLSFHWCSLMNFNSIRSCMISISNVCWWYRLVAHYYRYYDWGLKCYYALIALTLILVLTLVLRASVRTTVYYRYLLSTSIAIGLSVSASEVITPPTGNCSINCVYSLFNMTCSSFIIHSFQNIDHQSLSCFMTTNMLAC